MPNQNLTQAKKAKNDEFYTQYQDIEKEMNAYLEFDPDVFRGKTVLLPCDDPEWSNFTKYFAQNFERFGLKKLISTSLAADSKEPKGDYQPSLFESEDPQFDKVKTVKNGKIFSLKQTEPPTPGLNINNLKWKYLEGDGDFRSPEIMKLRDEADIIITNPPFSLFREFLTWITEVDKKLVIIGNMNAITYKEVFPLIKNNKLWIGNGFHAGNAYFATDVSREYADGVYNTETGLVKFRNCCWFTNIDHGRRHQPLPLMNMADNRKFNSKVIKSETSYQKYDNYDAIEIPFTNAIPSDYDGVMGVPISFLDKYSPEQFEIVGMCENIDLYNQKTKVYTSTECKQAYLDKFGKKGVYDLNASGGVLQGNILEKVYQRILIKHKIVSGK
jgi:Adenine-specific methyltransferase EcoRI